MNTLKIERRKSWMTVTIDREEKLNALSLDILSDLKEMLLAEAENHTTRGMILTASGEKAFIAGADIAAMQGMTKEKGEAFCALGQEVTLLFSSMPFPVIACVHGYALGGGCEIALSCDQIFATERAVFGQPEVFLGLIPGFGGCVRLADRVGIGYARDLIFTGRKISAAVAKEIGLVDRLFDTKKDMFSASEEFLHQTSKASPVAIAAAKRAIHAARGTTTATGLDNERAEFMRVFASGDSKEGIDAFLAKRPPLFS